MRAPTRRSALLLTAAALSGAARTSAAAPAPETRSAVAIGRSSAPVTVVEYASVTCGHCAAWDAEVWPSFRAKYVDTGKVRFEIKEMLTPPVQLSAAGWLLARCAGPAKSLSVVENLYRSQGEMARTADPRPILFRIGRGAGMTEQQVVRCLEDKQGAAALNKRVEPAIGLGVDRTPSFFINGRKHEGDIDLDGFDAALALLLARRR